MLRLFSAPGGSALGSRVAPNYHDEAIQYRRTRADDEVRAPLIKLAPIEPAQQVLVDLPVLDDHDAVLGLVLDQLDARQRVAVQQLRVR